MDLEAQDFYDSPHMNQGGFPQQLTGQKTIQEYLMGSKEFKKLTQDSNPFLYCSLNNKEESYQDEESVHLEVKKVGKINQNSTSKWYWFVLKILKLDH